MKSMKIQRIFECEYEWPPRNNTAVKVTRRSKIVLSSGHAKYNQGQILSVSKDIVRSVLSHRRKSAGRSTVREARSTCTCALQNELAADARPGQQMPTPTQNTDVAMNVF